MTEENPANSANLFQPAQSSRHQNIIVIIQEAPVGVIRQRPLERGFRGGFHPDDTTLFACRTPATAVVHTVHAAMRRQRQPVCCASYGPHIHGCGGAVYPYHGTSRICTADSWGGWIIDLVTALAHQLVQLESRGGLGCDDRLLSACRTTWPRCSLPGC